MKKFLLAILLPFLLIVSAYAKVFVLTSPPAATSNVPTITNSGNVPTFISSSGSGTPVPGDSNVQVTCACTTITGATVQITGGAFTNDALAFTNIFSITGSFAGTTMTLSGSDTVAHYQAALQTVSYSSTNADPTNGGSNPTRTLSWIATSAAGSSNTGTSTLNVQLAAPAPTLSGGGNSVTYTSGGAAATVNSGLVVTSSFNVTGATASITSGLLAGDLLNFTNQFSITGSYSNGILTLSGTDTAAHYQTAMRSITYSSTAGDPTNAGADITRTVTWQGANGSNLSNTVTSTVNVQNPAQPALSSVGNTISYTSLASPVALDNAIIVSCTCTTLTGATVTVTGGGTIASQDVMAATTTGTAILSGYNSATGVVTLSGTDTLANYQTVLRTIVYSSTATDATNGGLNPTRTFTWVASNSSVSSSPAQTFANVFVGGSQPTWAKSGAFVAFNPGTQQCWISGVGTGAISNCLQETRATQETCVNGSTITYAAPNVMCATAAGIQVLPAYTNLVSQSNTQANSAWVHFTTQSTGQTSSVSTTANSAVAPDGTTTATKVTVSRTTTGAFGDNASIINNGSITGTPAQNMSYGVWLKADGVGDVGKVISIYLSGTPTNTSFNYTLTSTWTNVTDNNLAFNACTGSPSNCQFAIGYIGAASGSQSGATNFDVWGAEVNAGAIALPTIATTTAPTNSAADNIIGLSPITTVMGGTASSILTSVSGALAANLAEVLDSNGTAVLEENTANQLATLLGGANNTGNAGVWTGTGVTIGYARNGSGRSFALNNGIVVKDAASTTVATPLTFGSSNTGANPLTGNIGITNMYNIRVADSVLGSTGTGTQYYFAAAGNDANPCTIAAPCQSMTKANSLTIVTNDQINFNGGDTFTGCLSFTGNSNWLASRTSPATIQSYGTGQAILTPNCTSGDNRAGIITFNSADGVVVNNLSFLGDTAGQGNVGVKMNNNDGTMDHGNYTIQNITCHNLHDATQFEGGCIYRNQTSSKLIDHISILNNTDFGTSTTSTDNNFLYYLGGKCGVEYDIIQGNLAFNLGGNAAVGFGNTQANGVLTTGACGAGSVAGVPSGTPGAIAQFNVMHDNGANMSGCGAYYAYWGVNMDDIIYRMNEAYNMQLVSGCDAGGFDFDGGGGQPTTNGLAERNYSHNNFGPCFLSFNPSNNVTFRWNICDADGVGNQALIQIAGNGLSYIYNNDINSRAVATNQFLVQYNGCPTAGSLLANNILVQRETSSGNQQFLTIGKQNTTSQCTPAPIGGLTIANNNWFGTHGGTYWTTTNSQNGSVCCSSTTTFAAMETLIGETGGVSVNPQFSNPYQNTTCNTTVGSPGPQANGCPSGFTLNPGSPMAAPAGATLTSAPFNLPTNNGGSTSNPTNGMGTLSYYGATLPCQNTVSGGYPIGADCGTSAAPPSFSLSFTSGTLPSCSGCNVAFSGGANGSWYDASNILHFNNAANTPRFDHNPANGSVLGILIEPSRSNYWASSNMTAANTNTSDNTHAGLAALCCGASQTTTGWAGVYSITTAAQKTGPDNVSLSAGIVAEDTNTYPVPADNGHASANAILPGTNGGSPFQLNNQNIVFSEFIRRNNDAGDAGRNVTFFPIDASGAGSCQPSFNLGTGSFISMSVQSPWTCSSPQIETINISGNVWYRISVIATVSTVTARMNSSLLNATTNSVAYTGDGHSGFMLYGVQATPAGSATSICVPGTSASGTCMANSYIFNANAYTAPVSTTADALSFTVPSGLCALTYTFDDNSTQKVTLPAGCSTGSTNYSVPTNLNRPWIKTIVGSVN